MEGVSLKMTVIMLLARIERVSRYVIKLSIAAVLAWVMIDTFLMYVEIALDPLSARPTEVVMGQIMEVAHLAFVVGFGCFVLNVLSIFLLELFTGDSAKFTRR